MDVNSRGNHEVDYLHLTPYHMAVVAGIVKTGLRQTRTFGKFKQSSITDLTDLGGKTLTRLWPPLINHGTHGALINLD